MKLMEILNGIELSPASLVEIARLCLNKACPEKMNDINNFINSLGMSDNRPSSFEQNTNVRTSTSYTLRTYTPVNNSNNGNGVPNAPTEKQMYRIRKIEEETGDKFTGSTKSDAFKFINSHSN